jgi:hypothetical protein
MEDLRYWPMAQPVTVIVVPNKAYHAAQVFEVVIGRMPAGGGERFRQLNYLLELWGYFASLAGRRALK